MLCISRNGFKDGHCCCGIDFSKGWTLWPMFCLEAINKAREGLIPTKLKKIRKKIGFLARIEFFTQSLHDSNLKENVTL